MFLKYPGFWWDYPLDLKSTSYVIYVSNPLSNTYSNKFCLHILGPVCKALSVSFSKYLFSFNPIPGGVGGHDGPFGHKEDW